MNKPKHTPELWNEHGCLIRDENGRPIADLRGRQNKEANTARIVQCCNAHDGLVEALSAIVFAAKLDKLPAIYPEWAKLVDDCDAALEAAKAQL